MLELVKKYFNEDLTEAEDEALNGELEASEEAASRFVELAGKEYYAFGLPEPHWPGSAPPGAPPAAPSAWGPWIGPLVAMTGLAALGFLGYHYCRDLAGVRPEKPVSGIIQQMPKPASSVSMHRKLDPGSSAAAKVVNPSAGVVKNQTSALSGAAAPGANSVAVDTGAAGLDKVPLKAGAEIPEAGSQETVKPGLTDGSSSPAALPASGARDVSSRPAAVKPPAGAGVVTPMAWNDRASKTYSNLSVVVDQPTLGFVTVQVTDALGNPAALLYRGALNPGKWVFEWDGKLAGTVAAPAGYYFIQLQSGSQVMRKKIQIH